MNYYYHFLIDSVMDHASIHLLHASLAVTQWKPKKINSRSLGSTTGAPKRTASMWHRPANLYECAQRLSVDPQGAGTSS